MIGELESLEAPKASENERAVVVAMPSHLPVARIFLHRLWKGNECWILLSNEKGHVLGLLANGMTDKLGEFLDQLELQSSATRCAMTEQLFGVGYAVITYSAAQWLTREVRCVLDMRPHVHGLLSGKAVVS
jgi:hypothetical protein